MSNVPPSEYSEITSEEILDELYSSCDDNLRAARRTIFKRFRHLLNDLDFDTCDAILRDLDIDRVDVMLTVGILRCTFAPRQELPHWSILLDKVTPYVDNNLLRGLVLHDCNQQV